MSTRWMNFLKERQANLSKQNATCQKCLQKGHWTYECKNERKYVYRTSRSRELNKHVKQVNKRKLAIEIFTIFLQKFQESKRQRKSSEDSESSSSSSSSDSSSSSSDSSSSSSDSDSSSDESSSDSDSSSS